MKENKAQTRNGVKRISRIRIDKMTFKKEIRIPIKNSNLCVCRHNITDVILQFEVFIAFIEARDGYDISHGIKIERMHDSTKNELHDER